MNKKRLEELKKELLKEKVFIGADGQEYFVRDIQRLIKLIDALLEEEPCTRKCCREK